MPVSMKPQAEAVSEAVSSNDSEGFEYTRNHHEPHSSPVFLAEASSAFCYKHYTVRDHIRNTGYLHHVPEDHSLRHRLMFFYCDTTIILPKYYTSQNGGPKELIAWLPHACKDCLAFCHQLKPEGHTRDWQ